MPVNNSVMKPIKIRYERFDAQGRLLKEQQYNKISKFHFVIIGEEAACGW